MMARATTSPRRRRAQSRRMGVSGAWRRLSASVFVCALVLLADAGQAQGADSGEHLEAYRAAAAVLAARCTSCHAGPRAEMGLRLGEDVLYRASVGVTARSDRRRRLVDPGSPESSLLYLKLLDPGQGGYSGPRMPMNGPPLSAGEIETVRRWIESFPGELWGPRPVPVADSERPRAFPDTQLAQMRSAELLTPGMLQFRILHRFKQEAGEAGASELYGLDGGAEISIGLSYGFGERFEAGLRRGSFGQALEAHGKFALADQARGAPVSAALVLSASRLGDESLANRDRVGAQLPVSRRFGERFSLLVTPAWSSHTNWLDPADARGTSAIAVGGVYKLNSFLSLTGEWIHPLSGVSDRYDAVTLGLAVGTSKHVFHLMVTNSTGLHDDLSLPGGDLDFAGGDFRLGFNISRLFDLRRSPQGRPASPRGSRQ